MPQIANCEILTSTDKVVERFMELDIDGSQSVSQAEYRAMVLERLQQRFSQMDKNRDHKVSADEYRTFWITQKSTYYRLKR